LTDFVNCRNISRKIVDLECDYELLWVCPRNASEEAEGIQKSAFKGGGEGG
jgi:hypothetical protein